MLEYSVKSGFALFPIACYTTVSNCYHLSMIVVPPCEVHNYFLMISWIESAYFCIPHVLCVR
jgi:hypothetical protein